MAQRRKRRSKAEIEAEKAAKAAAAAEAAEMEAQGFEKVRARDEHGHFLKDDPSTPENEAWEWQKKEEQETDDIITEMFEESVIEATFGSAYEKEIDALLEDPVKEEPAQVVRPAITKRDTKFTEVMHATSRFKEKRGRRRGLW